MNSEKPWIFPKIALGFTIAYPFISNYFITLYDDWHLSNSYGKEILDTDITRHTPLDFISIPLIFSLIIIILCFFLRKSKRDKFTSGDAFIINIVMLMIYSFVFLVSPNSNKRAYQHTCQKNMEEILMATNMYAEDYDSHLPPLGSNWNSLLKKYKFDDNSVLHCPIVKTSKDPTYAFIKNFAGINTNKIKKPEEAIVILESKPGKNLFGSKELLPKYPRHDGGEIYGFLDGHAQWRDRKGSTYQREMR